jgi:hypothetical protein
VNFHIYAFLLFIVFNKYFNDLYIGAIDKYLRVHLNQEYYPVNGTTSTVFQEIFLYILSIVRINVHPKFLLALLGSVVCIVI